MTTTNQPSFHVHQGDCLEVLRTLDDNSVDAVVTDPPYGLSFMGKGWDYDVPPVEVWQQCLRVLRPGGHLLAFAGTRTQHRMAVRIEDAGFDIRDLIAWVYGSGFPKSLDVSDAMQRRLAGERLQPEERVINPDIYKVTAFLRDARDRAGWTNRRIDELFGTNGMAGHWTSQASQPACPSQRQWGVLKQHLGFGDEMDALVDQIAASERPEDWGEGSDDDRQFLDTLLKNRNADPAGGWGTALKPALEPITMARKRPAGTVAQTILAHGTGALNIDACRIEATDGGSKVDAVRSEAGRNKVYGRGLSEPGAVQYETPAGGRWPSNLIHDGTRQSVDAFPIDGGSSASRFFYCAKASREDRDAGLDGFAEGNPRGLGGGDNAVGAGRGSLSKPRRNIHPTVKPTELMRYLVRLVTPPGGVVLDPYTGSGSTGKAALMERMRFIGIERDPEYVAIARARIAAAHPQAFERMKAQRVGADAEQVTLFDILAEANGEKA